MEYSLESIRLWDHTFLDKENPKLIIGILKTKALNNDAKLKCQEKRIDKNIAWTKNNIKYKVYISRICFSHIQQKF